MQQSLPDDKQPRASIVRRLILRPLARFFYELVHHIWSILTVLFCLLVYLWAIGLPHRLSDLLVARIRTGQFHVAVDRIRLDPREGLLGEGVRLYETADASEPLFSADRVGLRMDWRSLVHGQQPLKAVRVRNGTLRWPDALKAEPVRLTNMSADIRFESSAILFAGIGVSIFGVPLEGQGDVQFEIKPGQKGDVWAELKTEVDHVRGSPAWFGELCHALDGAHHEGMPHGCIDFHLFPDHSEDSEFVISADGGQTQLRGTQLDGWNVDVMFKRRVAVVSNLSLRVKSNTLQVAGTCDLQSHILQGRIFSDIPPGAVLKLLPGSYRKTLEQFGIEVRGGFKTELWAGPVDMAQIGKNFSGWMSLDDADLWGCPLVKAFAAFRCDGSLFRVTSFKGSSGRGARSGPVDGSLAYDATSGDLQGTLDLACFPDDFLPVMNPAQGELVGRFRFGTDPVHFHGSFNSRVGDGSRFTLQGRLQGTNLLYHEQKVQAFDTVIAYSNDVLALDPFEIDREEGTVTGRLGIDFTSDVYTVDLSSTADPNAVVGIVGPGLARGLSFLQFNGPARVHAFGRIDGNQDATTDLRVDVSGEQAALDWFRADTASLGVDAKGGSYIITNLAGTAFGGTFGGTIYVAPDTNTDLMRHALDIHVEDMDFSRMAPAFSGGTNVAYEGRLAGAFKVTGLADTNVTDSLAGAGHVTIKSGRLLQMPIFGGLSRMMSAVYPGLGFASQTDFATDFKIGRGKVSMKNAMFGGAVLSLRASGSYSFDGKLNFTVEVKPLRGGPLAGALRLLTLPMTKLLEFDLGGTLDHPKWRPTNLPKEMFLIFD